MKLIICPFNSSLSIKADDKTFCNQRQLIKSFQNILFLTLKCIILSNFILKIFYLIVFSVKPNSYFAHQLRLRNSCLANFYHLHENRLANI